MKRLGFFNKIELIISHPQKFFEKIKEEHNVWDVFRFYFIFVFASCIINTLFILPDMAKTQLGMPLLNYTLFVIVLAIFVLLLAFLVSLSSFVFYYIFHIIAKLFSGKGTFTDTYKLLYSAAPLLIVALIPYYGTFKILFWPLFIIAGLDAGYIELIGLEKIKKMHRINALTVVGIAAILGLIFLIFGIGLGWLTL